MICQFRAAVSAILAVATLLLGITSSGAEDATEGWRDAMLARVEAVERSHPPDPFPPFVSPILRGGDPAMPVSVNISGATELFLFVTGFPDVKWGVGDWCEPRLAAADGTVTHVVPGKNADILLGRVEKDLTLRSGLYQKLRLGDTTYERGMNVQADSVIRVAVMTNHRRFEATVGVDAWAEANGSVRFAVLGTRAAARERLYEQLGTEFPNKKQEMRWEREDGIFHQDFNGDIAGLATRYAEACRRNPALAAKAAQSAASTKSVGDLRAVRSIYFQSREFDHALREARALHIEDLQFAITDLHRSFPESYPARFESQLKTLQEQLTGALAALDLAGARAAVDDYANVAERLKHLKSFRDEALRANPLLKFDRLLAIKRKPIGEARRSNWEGYGYGEYVGVPRQSSWNNGTMANVDRWTNEIVSVPMTNQHIGPRTIFRSSGNRLINDPELHWNADKLLFSMPDTNRNWQVCEISADGSGFRQLTPSVHRDVHNYNGIYLPDGDIIFLSTAPLQGVPCNASVIVGMMYKMDGHGARIRQLTFEQDHDYTPSVMNDGRVMYLRWDYTDTPHIWNRILMTMNPDGTAQSQHYGGSSYWPNAIFFARSIPNHSTKVVGIVTGHHEGRVGELFIFDPAKGRHEISGVVQRIPKRGPPVAARIEDKLTEHSWPKFLHPWPLSDKYFLVACKPDPDALWGIYLVDVFDNMTLIHEEEGFALLNPIPLQPRPIPPVIENRTRPDAKDALVYLEDIYRGPGLKGVPQGTVKALRIFSYHFAYQKLAGIDHRVGADGPWEAKRILGTVPVEADGSALFTVPAKTPISLQPLDVEGKAVALMRSWLTAMPGEKISCVGCHEQVSTAPPSARHPRALGLAPSTPSAPAWGVHGFSFARHVQPVLDRYCVGCHDGSPRDDKLVLDDLRGDQGAYFVWENGKLDGKRVEGRREELLGKFGAVFEPSYVALRKFIRVGGLESDLHVLPAGEFHADTSELVQMLAKGHHNVRLDTDAWNRLVCWIDLNAPCHGAWGEVTKIPGDQRNRRLELRALYGGVEENCEETPAATLARVEPLMPEPEPEQREPWPAPAGWPITPDAAAALQRSSGAYTRIVQLGNDVTMELVRIPAGTFVMGDPSGTPDERPATIVKIAKPFWMARHEVSNRQFQQFKPHDSRFEHRSSWIFSEEYLGWPLNNPDQPVVRVSWKDAVRFCNWLSEKLGATVSLPTEAQWEYACRSGTSSAMWYGGIDNDFSEFGNMADANLRRLADEGWRPKAPDLVVRDDRFNDGALVTRAVGAYKANAWGLHDMHGNVAEWTRTTYAPYPYVDDDGRNTQRGERKVVRGGSWRDRPKNCRSGSRWAYPPWQEVYNVGFRIIMEINE